MKKPDKIFSLLILSSMIFSVLSLRNDFCWGDDFAQYILQAKSLISGDYEHFSTLNQIRVENSTVCLGPSNYPWGFPLILAPVIALFGENFIVFQLYLGLFQILFLFAVYALFRNRLNRIQLLMVIALFAFNPFLFEFKKNIISEIPFLFFSTLCIYFIQNVFVEDKYILRKRLVSYILVGILLFCVFFIRTAGVVLLLVYLFSQIFYYVSGKKIKSLDFLPYLVFLVLLYMESSCAFLRGASYKDVFGQGGGISFSSILANFWTYFKAMSDFYEIPVFSYVIYGITFPFFILGFVRRFSKDFLYGIFILGYIGMLVLFPANGGIRLLLPIMPFYFYFFMIGLERLPSITIKGIVQYVQGAHLMPFLIILICFMAISYQSVIIRSGKAKNIQGPLSEDSKELFDYIADKTGKKDSIIFWKPRAMILFSDRNSFIIKETDQILKHSGCYVVEENIGDIHVSQDHCFLSHSELLFENDSFKMYKILSQKQVCPQIHP